MIDCTLGRGVGGGLLECLRVLTLLGVHELGAALSAPRARTVPVCLGPRARMAPVSLLPLRPVALVAEEVAWLAARFPGRVAVGVAPGALPLDFEAMGVPFEEKLDRFRADLPRLVAMLHGDDLDPLAGDLALARCKEHPVPVISTALSPGAVRRAAAAGAGIVYDGASALDRLRTLSDAYDQAGGDGPKVLIRRVWLGAPPREAFDRQEA